MRLTDNAGELYGARDGTGGRDVPSLAPGPNTFVCNSGT